ncbi:MAG: S8 family serine peptidase [Verrucomicrobiales bacterium]
MKSRHRLKCVLWITLLLACASLWARSPRSGPPGPEWILWSGVDVRSDRLLARFAEKETAQQTELLASRGVTVLRRMRHPERVVVLTFDPVDGTGLIAKVKELNRLKLFEYVEPDARRRTKLVPTDEAFTDGRLWGLRNTGQNGGVVGADIDAARAWDVTTGSPVVVAVIDTGIRHTHQDLRDSMWRNPGESGAGRESNGQDDDGNGYVDDVHGINAITGTGDPMDDNEHGSHCAGTIGATANGGGPHVGVAWNVRLMGVKFLSAGGSGATSDAITGIDYAVAQGARILSNSWGGGGFSAALRDSITAARDRRILFVAAAGNDGSDIDLSPDYPAGYAIDNVVAVAAIDRSDRLADFSNFGDSTVHLAAPGVDIFSCTQSSDTAYDSFDGTSMAAPHVVGVAALILSAFPAASYADVRQRLVSGSRPIPALISRTQAGALDAHGSLTVVADGILELRISASQSPLLAGSRVNLFVTVTDLYPVVDATVDVRVGDAAVQRFADNGLSPDAQAGDGMYTGAIDVPASGNSMNVVVTASAREAEPVESTFILPIAVPPSNDDFASRVSVTSLDTRTHGSNVNASLEPGEQLQPSGSGSRSVWWTWTAAQSGDITISTAGSSFDTTLAVYQGNALTSLSLVAADDDSGGGLQSAVSFVAQAGTPYAIQVNGYGGATGAIVLNHPVSGGLPGAPVVVSDPVPTSVLVGQPFELRVVVDGNEPFSFQWLRNGSEMVGETQSAFSRSAATLADEGSYSVRISNNRGMVFSDSAFVGVEQVAVIPENDIFGAATPLPTGGGRLRSSNRLATGEPGEPNHGGIAAPLASLWWRWTAPDNGVLELNTFGSAFDTVLAAYQGDSLASLNLLAANDNADNSQQSTLSLPVTSGTTYLFAVDGTRDAVGVVFLNHSFAAVSPPSGNDAFANRRAVPASGIDTTSSVGASGEAGEPDHAGNSFPLGSVWWTWTAPQTGLVTISTGDSDFDTTLGVYRGTAVNALTVLASDDDGGGGLQSLVRLAVSAGDVLQIAVDGYGTEQGAVALSANFTSAIIANDAFANATVIPAGTTRVTGSTTGATGEPNEPTHHSDSANPLNSAWWRWTAATTGWLTIDLQESDFDTVLAVYQGASLSSLNALASNDDANASRTSQVSLAVTAGQTYLIAVDGYRESQGAVEMSLILGPMPVIPNDAFAQATPIMTGISRVTGSNVGATGEAGEPAHHSDDAPPIQSIWWRWTAPSTGTIVVDLSSSDFDTVLAVYEGASLATLALRASDDDGGSASTSRLTTSVTAGHVYYLAVDGYTTAVGNVIMTLTMNAPVPLAETLDSPWLAWTTGGDIPWAGEAGASVVGAAGGRSGALADLQSSWVQTSVTGPGRLRFWWRVDSEEDYDELSLSVNGTVTDAISGLQDWSSRSIDLPAGPQELRWTYAKDESFGDGEDAGWLDGVTFDPEGFLDWMAGHPAVPAASRGLWDDPDDDGHPNILEYYRNTPPGQGVPATEWAIPSRAPDNTFLLTYQRHKNPQGVQAVAEWSPNLHTWGASGATIDGQRVVLAESIDSSPPIHNRVTIRATGATQRLYLRLRVSLQ